MNMFTKLGGVLFLENKKSPLKFIANYSTTFNQFQGIVQNGREEILFITGFIYVSKEEVYSDLAKITGSLTPDIEYS